MGDETDLKDNFQEGNIQPEDNTANEIQTDVQKPPRQNNRRKKSDYDEVDIDNTASVITKDERKRPRKRNGLKRRR